MKKVLLLVTALAMVLSVYATGFSQNSAEEQKTPTLTTDDVVAIRELEALEVDKSNYENRGIEKVTVQRAAEIIKNRRGRLMVLLLWTSSNSRCTSQFEELTALVEKYRDKKVVFLPFSMDDNLEQLRQFLAEKELPFRTFWLEPWEPGEIEAEMKAVGVDLINEPEKSDKEKSDKKESDKKEADKNAVRKIDKPLYLVISSEGKVVSRLESPSDFEQVEGAVNMALEAAEAASSEVETAETPKPAVKAAPEKE